MEIQLTPKQLNSLYIPEWCLVLFLSQLRIRTSKNVLHFPLQIEVSHLMQSHLQKKGFLWIEFSVMGIGNVEPVEGIVYLGLFLIYLAGLVIYTCYPKFRKVSLCHRSVIFCHPKPELATQLLSTDHKSQHSYMPLLLCAALSQIQPLCGSDEHGAIGCWPLPYTANSII